MDTAVAAAPPPAVLLSTLVCEDDARSNGDGSLSLLRVFYVIPTAGLPARRNFVVVTFWWLRGTGQVSLDTRVRDLDGGVLAELGGSVSYDGNSVHEQSARFVGLEFGAAGIYRVEVLLDGDVVGAYPLFVEVAAPPSGTVVSAA